MDFSRWKKASTSEFCTALISIYCPGTLFNDASSFPDHPRAHVKSRSIFISTLSISFSHFVLLSRPAHHSTRIPLSSSAGETVLTLHSGTSIYSLSLRSTLLLINIAIPICCIYVSEDFNKFYNYLVFCVIRHIRVKVVFIPPFENNPAHRWP